MIVLEERNQELLQKFKKKHEEFQKYSNLVNHVNIVKSYLENLDWKVKENSNMSFSLQGLNNYITSKVTTDFWLSTIYSAKIADAHKEGDMHIHDLSMLSPYCVGWDLMDLLLKGFGGVSNKIQSLPPKHFKSALGQIVNFFYTLQGESAGAQAFSNLDTLLAPFIRFDNLSYDEVKQALQEFIFNLNIPTRTGFQTPFTNLTFDLKCSPIFKQLFVIIGGKPVDFKYGEFQKEMDLLNKAFADVMIEGDASGRVFSFPIPTYNITKDFDWDNENYEKIWIMTAKYGVPYFANYINSDMKPEDAMSMCCRLRLDKRQLNKRGGGLFGSNPLTGSLGVVTINLPRISFISKSMSDFKENLLSILELAKDSLELKRVIIEQFTELGLYPYSKFYLSSIKKNHGEYWANHFSTIGIVGMNEALINLVGKDITSSAGSNAAKEILDFMREKILEYQKKTGNNYNLEATPAEGTSYRLANLDNKKFSLSNSYYTNSSQLPVGFTDDLFHALDLQDEIQCKYTGGTVFHAFIGEELPDSKSVKQLVKKIASNYSLPYFTLTPTFSICLQHNYISGKHEICPTCGKKCEVYSRIVGYLRPVDQWNKGKQKEFFDRKEFLV